MTAAEHDRPPAAHLAVLHRAYLDAVLAGTKTVEARLTQNRSVPFGRIRPGDTVYLKQASGPVRAVAQAGAVRTFENLTPERVDDIRLAHDHLIAGRPDYWQRKRDARYATLIWLESPRPLQPSDPLPEMPTLHGSAWAVLGPAAHLLS